MRTDTLPAPKAEVIVNDYVRSVYNWMGIDFFDLFYLCGTFAACSIYGWTAKRDLTSLGGFLLMGLFGIMIATVVNLFLMLLRIFGQSRE